MKVTICSKNILNNADDFRTIALIINKEIKENRKCYPVQFFVNSIFAIELYLKTIYLANNKKYIKDIHNLEELFNIIPQKDRKSLNSLQSNIKNILEEYSNSYIKWRYSYEQSGFISGNDEKIIQTLNTLHNYCNKEYKKTIYEFYNG